MNKKSLDATIVNSFLRENDSAIQNLNSNDPLILFHAVEEIRSKLSGADTCRCVEVSQVVIEIGLIPRFLELLKDFEHPNIQLESGWVLTNVLSGSPEQTQAVVDLGAIPLFIDLFKRSKDDDVRAQALWALGNIIGDRKEYKDQVLATGIFPIVLDLVQPSVSSIEIDMLRNIAFVLSNIFNEEAEVLLDMVKQSIPLLASILENFSDSELIENTCCAFASITKGSSICLHLVREADILPRIILILNKYRRSPEVLHHAVLVFGRITASLNLQTQSELIVGAVHAFPELIMSSNEELAKAVVEANLIPLLVELCYEMNNGYIKSVALSATWKIANTPAAPLDRYITGNRVSPRKHDPNVFHLVLMFLKRLQNLHHFKQNNIPRLRAIGVLRKLNLL